MEKQDIINYVLNTPENTNPVILNGMLSQLEAGGGGESNIKTATVTLVNTGTGSLLAVQGYIEQTECVAISDGAFDTETYSFESGGDPLTVAFFDSFTVSLGSINDGTTPTVTGDATIAYDEEQSAWVVTCTGDCTISAAYNE